MRRKLLENLLLEDRTHVGWRRKISFAPGVAALTTHVDEIGEWLSPGGSFVKISPLAPECVRRNHALGLEFVVADGTTKVYLTQRCHGYSSLSPEPSQKREKEYLCHDFQILLGGIGLVGSLGRLYLLASQNRDRLSNRELVVDAHQPTA
jgi:hypothetical protein